MNDLQKRFEEETEGIILPESHWCYNNIFNNPYVKWLESQLTWRKVEELPEKSGRIIACLGKSNEPITGQWNVFSEIFDADDGEIYSKRNIKNWLPIPKLEKEEV